MSGAGWLAEEEEEEEGLAAMMQPASQWLVVVIPWQLCSLHLVARVNLFPLFPSPLWSNPIYTSATSIRVIGVHFSGRKDLWTTTMQGSPPRPASSCKLSSLWR